jgi:hypothetical protein
MNKYKLLKEKMPNSHRPTDSFTDWTSVSFTNPMRQGLLIMRWSVVQLREHTSHSKHLKTSCLWWQYCAPTNSANLHRGHCAGHIEVSTIFSPWLHQHHAVAAAHVLGWILQHQKCIQLLYQTLPVIHAAKKPECSQKSIYFSYINLVYILAPIFSR